jgi:mRNA interferase RelE/StbE
MSEYTISFIRSAHHDLSRLDKKIVARIFPKIEALAIDPRPPGCRKLQGADSLWRIRVGDYRVIYSILDQELVIEIVTVRHRRDAYRFG